MPTTPLAVTDQGKGVPLVLVHAFPLSRLMWQAEVARLAKVARVIAPDLPGFGRSPRMPEPSMEGMAALVAQTLQSLGVKEPVVLCGVSMGGYVAFEFLRQYPQLVRGLGLFSTRAAADNPAQREGRLKLIERLGTEGIGVLKEASVPKLLGETTKATRPAVVEQVTAWARSADVGGVQDALRAMAARRDSTPLLADIRCPALVIAGAEDALIPAAEAESMATAIKGAKLEVVPQAGHLVNLEQPQRFHLALDRLVPKSRRF